MVLFYLIEIFNHYLNDSCTIDRKQQNMKTKETPNLPATFAIGNFAVDKPFKMTFDGTYHRLLRS